MPKKKKTAPKNKRAVQKESLVPAAKAKGKSARRTRSSRKAVRARIYRLGFGECTLLTIPKVSRGYFHVLIDCGVSPVNKRSSALMRNVASDIASATRGRIDLLIISNQKRDHLSGFLQAQKEFDAIEIRRVCTSWTEDPRNELAMEIHEALTRRRETDRIAAEVCRADAHEADTHPVAPGQDAASSRDALDYLSGRISGAVEYLAPGERLSLQGVKGVSAYVLGPPTSRQLLRRSRPQLEEVYVDSASALGVGDQFGDSARGDAPFDEYFRIEPADAMDQEFFRERYRFDARLEWRRIGGTGIADRAPATLQATSDVNITSMALAFHLEGSRKVLLFPSDAQVGNWASWEGLDMADAKGGKIKSGDLLANTVLFKVGQQGSQTGTPKDGGLELMSSTDLVALIPADRTTATTQRRRLPAEPLLDRLLEKTRGRVLLTDEDALPRTEDKLSSEERKAFEKSHRITRLYVECIVPL